MQLEIEIYSTCPASAGLEPPAFRRRVLDVARWSERHGCRGMLVYTDNSLVDPWVVAQLVIEHTDALRPLVAVQPVYRHPYTVAKTVASLGHLWRRGVDLNMVAGGFVNDLSELADTTPHDRRYDRLREYTEIVARLLAGQVFLGDERDVRRTHRIEIASKSKTGLSAEHDSQVVLFDVGAQSCV